MTAIFTVTAHAPDGGPLMAENFAGVQWIVVMNEDDGTDLTTFAAHARRPLSTSLTLPFTATISVWTTPTFIYQISIVPAAIHAGDTTETTNSVTVQFQNLPPNATVYSAPGGNIGCAVPRTDVPYAMSYCNAGTSAAPRVQWTVGQSYTFSVRSP
jgi:hypothetical protein